MSVQGPDDDLGKQVEDFLRKLDEEKLTFTHNVIKARKIKEPTIEFLDMLARNPQYVLDHQRPGNMQVPKKLRFNHAVGDQKVKSALLSARIIENKDGSEPYAYVSISYGALAKLFPERKKLSRRDKWMDTHFEQRRCPDVRVPFTNLPALKEYMHTVENVLVYFLARYGSDGRKLHRDADGAAVMPRVNDKASGTYLRKTYSKAVAYGSFAGAGPEDIIPFGTVTRTLLPYFCDLITLHYHFDEASRRATTFAFPMLDIGKMRFENEGADNAAHYLRIANVQGREIIRQDAMTTGEWMRHEMADMLAGPMREMEIIPKDFLANFFGVVDEIRTIIKEGGAFNPNKLSPAHEALITRLQ